MTSGSRSANLVGADYASRLLRASADGVPSAAVAPEVARLLLHAGIVQGLDRGDTRRAMACDSEVSTVPIVAGAFVKVVTCSVRSH
jgi:hypothetical protein